MDILLGKNFRSGCGGKTRTYDLRVMSPASCQLLHPAIYNCDNLTVDLLSIQQYVKNVNGFYKNFDI